MKQLKRSPVSSKQTKTKRDKIKVTMSKSAINGKVRPKLPKTKTAQTSAKVAKVMHEFKTGKLKSGSTNKPVTNKKQGIAIALSEARRAAKPK